MSPVSKTVMEAPLLRLPVELIQEIAGYIGDPKDLCSFVSSCRQTYYYLGSDFVHIQCAKAGAKVFAGARTHISSLEWKSTLDTAAKGIDKDIFARILDIYIAHYPQCLDLWSSSSPGFHEIRYDRRHRRLYVVGVNDGPLITAVDYHNSAAVQLLLDRGAKILRSDFEKRWEPSFCPLYHALRYSTVDIVRSLIAAGHMVNEVHTAQAVGSNNVELAEMLIDLGLQAKYAEHEEFSRRGYWALGDPARIPRKFWGSIPFSLVLNRGADKDTRMLDLVIRKGKCIKEFDRGEHWEGPTRLSASAPVGLALNAKCPRIAISLLEQQVQKDLHDPRVLRRIIDRLCYAYFEDQHREHGKPPNFHATFTTFMKGFHPKFTPYLFRSKLASSDEHATAKALSAGSDFLLSTVLQNCSPSQEVVKHLFRNGCTVSTDMLLTELRDVWVSASHCLASNKNRRPDLRVCSKCDQIGGILTRFGHKKCSLKSSMSRLDALLSRMSTDSIDAPGSILILSDDERYEDRESITTPLDFAVSRGLWDVAYRLIYYGADLSLLNKRSRDSICRLYKDTFVRGGDIHPLVQDARDGKFLPDKRAFSSGLGPKRDRERQVLTLVMMTIGLAEHLHNKRCDSDGWEVASLQKRFTRTRR